VPTSFTRFVVCMSYNASIAGLGVLMLPIAVGALADRGVGAGVLGLLAFLELGFAAATAILLSGGLRKTQPALICALGGAIAAAGNAASALSANHAALLLAFRPFAGIGTGLMTAAGLALVARLPTPERMYGYIGMAPCLSALLGFLLAPWLLRWGGGALGIFAFQAVLAALNAVLMYVNRSALTQYVTAEAKRSGDAHTDSAPSAAGRPELRAYVAGLGSSFLLAFCDASIWTFVAPVGQVAGISLEGMSHVLVLAAILGTLGPLLAGRMGARFGFLVPLGVGQGLMAALGFVMVTTHVATVYSVALYLRVFTVLFLQPMYQGLYARVDSIGRVVAASAGASAIGYSVGPLFAGQFISTATQDFHNLGAIAAVAAALSFAMTLLIAQPRKIATAARARQAY
jgi:predicted MFS family arabinose efflux permease